MFGGARKFAAVFFHDFLCCALQISSAAVIAEPGPQSQHFRFGRCGERANRREVFEKSLVKGNHRGDARLLQHNFRKPDAIRIFIAPPGQITLKFVKPFENRCAKHCDTLRVDTVENFSSDFAFGLRNPAAVAT